MTRAEEIIKKIDLNMLEVEDILKLAKYPKEETCMFLEKSINKYNWKSYCEVDRGKDIPFASWARVVIEYIKDDLQGLRNLITKSKSESSGNEAYFVIFLLESIGTKKSVIDLMTLFSDVMDEVNINYETSKSLVEAFNLMLSFSSDIKLNNDEEERIRIFLCKYLDLYGSKDRDRALTYLALRGIGDNSSIELINLQKKIESDKNLVGIENIVVKHIKKRLLRKVKK